MQSPGDPTPHRRSAARLLSRLLDQGVRGRRKIRCLPRSGLIEALTRRLFNHVEHGLNVPGTRLDEARRAFDAEPTRGKKRVKGAMLAGALFNRATDIFTKAGRDAGARHGDRARQCADARVRRAPGGGARLGKLVLHRSGEEGIDELWGEPFKAFAFPIEDFYRSRYMKIAPTMRDIDRICEALKVRRSIRWPMFAGVGARHRRLRRAPPKLKCETLRTEPTSSTLDLVRGRRRAPGRVRAAPCARACDAREERQAPRRRATARARAKHWSRRSRAPASRCRRARASSSSARARTPRRRMPRRRRAPAQPGRGARFRL